MNIYLQKMAIRTSIDVDSKRFSAHEIRKITVLDRSGLPLKTAAVKQPTLRDVVEGQMHSAWTTLFDNLHAQGYMGTKERISYSGAISKFLEGLKFKRNFKVKAEDVPFLTKTANKENMMNVYLVKLATVDPAPEPKKKRSLTKSILGAAVVGASAVGAYKIHRAGGIKNIWARRNIVPAKKMRVKGVDRGPYANVADALSEGARNLRNISRGKY